MLVNPGYREFMVKDCGTCNGSGNKIIILNPDWPNGTVEHQTIDHCDDCDGTGKIYGDRPVPATGYRLSATVHPIRSVRVTSTIQLIWT